MDYPPTRDAARRAREKHYFTGKPCRWGHVALRRTGNMSCVKCDEAAKTRLNDTRKATREANKPPPPAPIGRLRADWSAVMRVPDAF